MGKPVTCAQLIITTQLLSGVADGVPVPALNKPALVDIYTQLRSLIAPSVVANYYLETFISHVKELYMFPVCALSSSVCREIDEIDL